MQFVIFIFFYAFISVVIAARLMFNLSWKDCFRDAVVTSVFTTAGLYAFAELFKIFFLLNQ